MNQEFQINRRRRLAHEINVVPYIDVMLVLLVIFMVTAPLLTPGVEINLPETSADAIDPTGEGEPIKLTVTEGGLYFLNVAPNPTEDPVGLAQIESYLAPLLSANSELTVMVEGDANAPYGAIARAMAALQNIGINRIAIVTDTPADTELVAP